MYCFLYLQNELRADATQDFTPKKLYLFWELIENYYLLKSIPGKNNVINASTNCGMDIPLSDDKHRKVWDSSKRTGNLRKIQYETKCSLRIFFWSEFFFRLNFVLDWILYRTEFVSDWILSRTGLCLGLNLSRTEFCLGLHTAVVFRMESFNLAWH